MEEEIGELRLFHCSLAGVLVDLEYIITYYSGLVFVGYMEEYTDIYLLMA